MAERQPSTHLQKNKSSSDNNNENKTNFFERTNNKNSSNKILRQIYCDFFHTQKIYSKTRRKISKKNFKKHGVFIILIVAVVCCWCRFKLKGLTKATDVPKRKLIFKMKSNTDNNKNNNTETN